ncbi:Serine/threonine-protein phosphatase 6 regulatory ankyrin repeat subunit [Globisporangium polare]
MEKEQRRSSSFRRTSSSGSLTRHVHDRQPARRSASSALHAATANGHLESVKLLLAAASDDASRAPLAIDALDAEGVTALYIAACNGFTDIARWLLTRGADVEFSDGDGETPLYVATLNGFLDIVILLLDIGGANVNRGDADGATPMYVACEHGRLKVAQALLERGASAEIADAAGDTPLHVAAQNGHVEVVKLLLTRQSLDMGVDRGNTAGVTALSMASQYGFVDVVRVLLLQGGAHVDTADSEGVTPLSMAAHNGHLDVVHVLLDGGAAVNSRDADGEAALHFAAQNGHSEVVQQLSERDAIVDGADKAGVTALSIASQNGHCRAVEVLLERGASVDIVDSDGDTALIVAAQYGHVDVVQVLARSGATIDFPDADGATALYLASQNGHDRVVAFLLQIGAEPDFAEGDGATPLYAAAYNGHCGVVESLLAHGAKADFVAEIGVTPLYAAAFNGYAEIVKILLARGVQVDSTTAVGVTPLYIASQNGFVGTVEVLLEGCADVNLPVPSGATPLFIAAQNGHLRVVELLIKGGAVAKLADADGATPLQVSCQNGHADVVQLLLEQDVSVNRATATGKVTPLYIAAQNGHADVVEILLAADAKVDVTVVNGATPLYIVAKSGHLEIATILIQDGGASVNLAGTNGMTPLYAASQNGHVEVVKHLIQLGAVVDSVDDDGDSPLMVAAQNGHVDVAEILLDNCANVNLSNAAGISSLRAAVQYSHRDMVALLLRHGAQANQCAKDGTTPLCTAAFFGYLEVLTLLLDADAEIDFAEDRNPTPLYAAAYNGHADVVRALIDRGAEVDTTMADGTSALYIAAQNGHVPVANLLLDRGASVEAASCECPGAIYIASQNGYHSVVELLIRQGAEVNATGPNGSTPLLVASQFGHLDIVRLLVRAGASVDAADLDGNTPLISASRGGIGDIARVLLDEGAAIEAKNTEGETALLAAGRMGKFDVVKLLVVAGASAHVKAGDGETLLISAARSNDLEAVSFLIGLGCFSFGETSNPRVESPLLLPATLQSLDEYGVKLFEFETMWHGAVMRLKVVYNHFKEEQITEPSLLHQLVVMIFRLFRLYQMCARTNIFTRIAISARVTSSVQDFHTKVDYLDRRAKKESSGSSEGATSIHAQERIFSDEALPSDEELYSILNGEAEQIEAITLLRHEISSHSDKHGEGRLALMELCLDKLLSLSDVHVPPTPSWFVPRHEIAIEASNTVYQSEARRLQTGRWMNSTVVVAEYREQNEEFNKDADKWFQLSHPNARMLEAALGLKYLHERGIVLGKLSCDNIWIGTDGVAKICGFGLGSSHTSSIDGLDIVRWTSPEVLRGESPASASDVYSLGMCIIEAVTGQAPWGSETCEQVRSLVKWGFRPPRPPMMSIAQWRLIQCMCVFDPQKRLRLVSVIEHLRFFATEDGREQKVGREKLRTGMSRIPELGVSIEEFLPRLRAKCMLCRSAGRSVLYVHARLLDIHRHLQKMHKLPTDLAVTKFCEVLLSFDAFVRIAVSEDSVKQQAKSQKVALKAHVHHKEIDELVELLNITKVGSIHDWQRREAQVGAASLRRNKSDEGHPLSVDVTGGAVRILRFESKHLNEKFNPTKFGLADRRIREQAQPAWFIPMHELKFQQDGYITAGSFGAVYHGSWLGTPVVVKLMGYEDEANGLDFFLHELRIWYPLSHPHIVKLYGACHVGKRFFVCEYAPNGTLKDYLHVGERRRLVLWQKLYEVALGLQYLHELNIIHNDLKCDNFLVGSDGKAKVTDFGLSCIPNSAEVKIDIRVQGAQHWKSPEHLQGERPTKASDIYTLGMCVLEAVTGEAPWGAAADVTVRFHVRKGRLPVRPAATSDDQWDLLEMMCASDPSHRINMQSVVERLDDFAKQEAAVRIVLEPDAEP